MKRINSFVIDTGYLPATRSSRAFSISGESGAVFSLVVKNVTGRYYNFETKKFQTTNAKLTWAKIPSSGIYIGSLIFPAVTSNTSYDLTLNAEYYFDTEISRSLANTVGYRSNNSLSLTKTINQYTQTSITVSLNSTSNIRAYDTLPADVVLSGNRSGTSKTSIKKGSFNWPISLKDGSFSIIKQPTQTDFSVTINKTVEGAYDGSDLIFVTDTAGLNIGDELFSVTGNDFVKDSTLIVQTIAETKTLPTDGDATAYQLEVSGSQTHSSGETATFKSNGLSSAQNFHNATIVLTDLKMTIDTVSTTTSSAVSASTTIPLTSVDGIKVGSVVSGLGIDNSTADPTVTNMSSLNAILSAAQTLESGVTLAFAGSSRTATITGNIEVTTFGDNDFTITLELDNILKVF